MKSLNVAVLTMITACCLHAPSLWADVTLHQNFTVSASGMMSMMGANGTATTVISGDRARTENHVESTSALMRRFAKNANTATIVRVDDERMLNLMPDRKEYSEITFAEMRAQMEKSMAAIEEVSEENSLPVSEDECQWTPPELSVNNTGEKQKFAGIKAQQTVITVSQTCTIPNSDKSCKMIWNLEYWNADKLPGGDEAAAFQKGMAHAMGGDEVLGMAQTYTRGLLAMFKKGWDDVLKEGGKVEGYPVKTVMSLEMGGENCTTGSGQPIALDDVWSSAADASMNAATSSAAGQVSGAVGQKTAESVGSGVGGSIAGSAIGAASHEIIGSMFSKMRKKKEKPKPAAEAVASASDTVKIFEITSELTGVDDKKADDDLFVVPPGWKKVAINAW